MYVYHPGCRSAGAVLASVLTNVTSSTRAARSVVSEILWVIVRTGFHTILLLKDVWINYWISSWVSRVDMLTKYQ